MRRGAGWMRWLAVVAVAAGCASTSGSPIISPVRDPASHRLPATRSSPSPSPSFTPAQSLIERAYWEHDPQGWRIRVMPSIYGRNYAPDAPAVALTEALTAARPTPLHLTPTMRHSLLNQLRCHADFAPTKPLWDLETWRPDVGYYRTVAAFCNPGGAT